MRYLSFLCAAAAVFAQERSVAITVDDLPYTNGALVVAADSSTAAMVNRKLLDAFESHRVPVTGFVIQKVAESLNVDVLKEWTSRGFDLGNHTYSHIDGNSLSVEQIEQEIVRGEAGRKMAFFRFPQNHTGDTQEKHDAVAAFLAQRGYRLATCTIDTSDYLFNAAYVQMLAKNDAENARKLRGEYLAYTSTEIDYYSALNKQVLGYEPPHVMLLHANRLNADVIEQILRLFEEKRYNFVSLKTAQSDAAYRTPETFITKFGPMWGYRWAKVRNVKVDGKLETEPSDWILQYGKTSEK